MRCRGAQRTDSERGQALVLLLGLALALLAALGVFAALGNALLGKGRYQRAADLAAVSAARSMRDDFPRLFQPSGGDGSWSGRLERRSYLDRARAAAIANARANGASLAPGDVSFPDARSFAPLRVRVRLGGPVGRSGGSLRARASAEAAVVPPGDPGAGDPWSGGYAGPFAYRQGKPMRPDVAAAFDRMQSAAAGDGIRLTITSAYRSDAEQARLFARHPDPRWVARPGRSLHRNATELDLGPPAAYAWLAAHARRFGFVQRYSWEPWHYETPLAQYRK
jgi:hypothetical protein